MEPFLLFGKGLLSCYYMQSFTHPSFLELSIKFEDQDINPTRPRTMKIKRLGVK